MISLNTSGNRTCILPIRRKADLRKALSFILMSFAFTYSQGKCSRMLLRPHTEPIQQTTSGSAPSRRRLFKLLFQLRRKKRKDSEQQKNIYLKKLGSYQVEDKDLHVCKTSLVEVPITALNSQKEQHLIQSQTGLQPVITVKHTFKSKHINRSM